MEDARPEVLPTGESPAGQRLTHLHELIGQTIKAAIDCPMGAYGGEGVLVLVTETGAWMVLEAEVDAFEDDAANLSVRLPSLYFKDAHVKVGREELLTDYCSALDLLSAGLITEPLFEELKAKEESAKAARNKAKADALRQQADRLEGTA